MSRNESVDVLRKKIDQIDEKIVNLLNDRAALAQRIGHSKSLYQSRGLRSQSREGDSADASPHLTRGPLPAHAIRSVFREIISACRSLEAPLQVAFFGAEATYSHLAAQEKFGSSAELLPTASIAEVFQEVSQDRAIVRRGADREFDRRRGGAYARLYGRFRSANLRRNLFGYSSPSFVQDRQGRQMSSGSCPIPRRWRSAAAG